jgi:phospholipid/cholesterol/gamma-HCH transport system ATP-binding protein
MSTPSPPDAAPIIEFIDVHKSFGPQKVLDGLNLTIPRGRTTVIIGRSGTGKSVLLKHAIGLLKPDAGTVKVDGVDLSTLSGRRLLELRRRFGMCFQNAALFDSMSVGENVAFPLVEHTDLKRARIREVVQEKLKLVGLVGMEDKMPAELSGGMRKRVGIARAIALEPEIMLYDEPTTGLDPIMSGAIDDLIQHMQRELNLTVVVISHDIKATFQIAHNVAMLYEGKLLVEGTPQALAEDPNPILRQFLEGRAEGPIRIT